MCGAPQVQTHIHSRAFIHHVDARDDTLGYTPARAPMARQGLLETVPITSLTTDEVSALVDRDNVTEIRQAETAADVQTKN